ncbi:hypothetical protein [Legionella oakridgensis]|uniref:Uncharacterized protein n=2 Tax=Legionella oakridgensis TaxID=29423 RepID=W0BG08_9GAMM|nr:hypothetical protein [Legionella oakridgensis]AHE67567.1 hypothetical protein Loa_02023 [Legionella oakridgensis ATCC 33761 = DSM 21215]ETO92812.1 hypothetical protein LOR_61c14660 [Legionella oakridgensis RV-2-2007]KTD37082.1 hypothetical protein Loak_2218 [Legionella oakridgensis]STY20609.1 Uncharacterised protein [Legionella longbeachae]
MSNKTEEFLNQCAENKKAMQEHEDYCSPTISALDLDDIVDTRGGSATTTTTTGAAVAAGVSALF